MAEVIVAGSLVHDRTAAGLVPGGAAAYAAAQASRLGYAVTLVSSHAGDVHLGLNCRRVTHRSALTTTFENRYDGSGTRRQRVPARGEPIPPALLAGLDGDIFFAGTVLDEVSADLLRAAPGALKGLGAQGFFRSLDAEGNVSQAEPAPGTLEELGGLVDLVFLSYEDLPPGSEARCIERLRSAAPGVVITDAKRGADVLLPGRQGHVDAFPAMVTDPTGAGDVFAIAFLCRYFETASHESAARFASAAAALSVEGSGVCAVPGRLQIEERMERFQEVQLRWRT